MIFSWYLTLSNESNNWRQKSDFNFFSCVPPANPFRKKNWTQKMLQNYFPVAWKRGSFQKNTDFVIIFSVLEKQDKKQNVQRRITCTVEWGSRGYATYVANQSMINWPPSSLKFHPPCAFQASFRKRRAMWQHIWQPSHTRHATYFFASPFVTRPGI